MSFQPIEVTFTVTPLVFTALDVIGVVAIPPDHVLVTTPAGTGVMKPLGTLVRDPVDMVRLGLSLFRIAFRVKFLALVQAVGLGFWAAWGTGTTLEIVFRWVMYRVIKVMVDRIANMSTMMAEVRKADAFM